MVEYVVSFILFWSTPEKERKIAKFKFTIFLKHEKKLFLKSNSTYKLCTCNYRNFLIWLSKSDKKFNKTRPNKFGPLSRQLVIQYLLIRYSIRLQKRLIRVCLDLPRSTCICLGSSRSIRAHIEASKKDVKRKKRKKAHHHQSVSGNTVTRSRQTGLAA